MTVGYTLKAERARDSSSASSDVKHCVGECSFQLHLLASFSTWHDGSPIKTETQTLCRAKLQLFHYCQKFVCCSSRCHLLCCNNANSSVFQAAIMHVPHTDSTSFIFWIIFNWKYFFFVCLFLMKRAITVIFCQNFLVIYKSYFCSHQAAPLEGGVYPACIASLTWYFMVFVKFMVQHCCSTSKTFLLHV